MGILTGIACNKAANIAANRSPGEPWVELLSAEGREAGNVREA